MSDSTYIYKTLKDQQSVVSEAFEGVDGGKLKANTMSDLVAELTKICMENDLFCRDINSGLVKTKLPLPDGKQVISIPKALDLFRTHFKERIRLKTHIRNRDGDIIETSGKVSASDLETLFNSVMNYSVYNSRLDIYNAIPEWDGVERIKTFMRDYYDCDSNPNFFLLFLTSIMGKMKNPEESYVPFFFDFVGNKGVGKTLLFQRLVGERAANLVMTSRKEDFLVNAYDNNLIIVCDDECKWTHNSSGYRAAMSYDEFKAFITDSRDIFSRKFQQPETHYRSFIVVRTSNVVKTAHSTDERRQVIFRSKLPDWTCKIKPEDEGDELFQQLLAEAKVYYEKNGMYKLTSEDWQDIARQNLLNFDCETKDINSIKEFINFKLKNPSNIYWQVKTAPTVAKGIYCSWENYDSWRKESHNVEIDSRDFWRDINYLAKIPNSKLVVYAEDERILDENFDEVRVFQIVPTESEHGYKN